MKQGFTIIELIIAFAIGSLLSGIIFKTFFQSNRLVQIIEHMIVSDTSAMVALNQLEKDILGICTPIIYPEENNKEKKIDEKNDNQKEPQKNNAEKNKKTDQDQKKKKNKPLTKIFYATEQDEMTTFLSFITTNALPSYWNGAIGRARPKIVRVLYKLEQEPQAETYRLLRKESAELDFEKSQKDKTTFFYELATGIEEFSLEFIAIKENKEGKKSEKLSRTWNIKEDKKNNQKKIPDYIRITIGFAGDASSNVFDYTVPVVSQPYSRQKENTAKLAEKSDKKDASKQTEKSTTKQPEKTAPGKKEAPSTPAATSINLEKTSDTSITAHTATPTEKEATPPVTQSEQ